MEEKGPKNKQGRKGRGVLQREADEEEHGTVDQQDVEKHENGAPPHAAAHGIDSRQMRRNESLRDNASIEKGVLSRYT